MTLQPLLLPHFPPVQRPILLYITPNIPDLLPTPFCTRSSSALVAVSVISVKVAIKLKFCLENGLPVGG